MRRFFLSITALQFALAVATAQPVPTSTGTKPLSLDQRSTVPAIIVNNTAKPVVHVELLDAHESLVVLPLVPLHLLLPVLIGGATSESGIGSVYSGRRTASGEQSPTSGMTAAHRSIPFGTKVRVTNRANGKSVVVRINDRGPFTQGRIIDLMPPAARELGFSGVTPVTLVIIDPAEHQ